MIVVVAEYLPPAVRGRMKLWFVEPKPNVFVSGIKDSVADDVVNYLIKHCPAASALMIFKQIKSAPGYEIWSLGYAKRPIVQLSGLQLILEK
jgi:CRISPR-associated protein Cas2